MTFGLVARCDQGGLAALTREIHRHLQPERTLLVEVPEARRGPCVPDDYQHGNIYQVDWRGALPDRAIEWTTAEGIDQLLTAEFWYDDRLLRAAHGNAIRTATYAMPELSAWAIPGDESPCSRTLYAPTWWRLDTLPNATLLPMPVARDRLPFARRKRVEHLYHQAGTPFHDRNGTQILLDALPFVQADGLRLTVHTTRWLDIPRSRVDVALADPAAPDYWDVYPPDIDLLALPRRYGGLSLPIQECASLGVPSLVLASDPYAQEPFCVAVPSTGAREEQMKGGRVPVHSADPRVLARAIDYLVEHPEDVEAASGAADGWAAEHDWAGPLGDRWRHTFGGMNVSEERERHA